jgi:hypothetical protein
VSDTFHILIPEDPRHVPDLGRLKQAEAYFRGIAPQSPEVSSGVSEIPRFFDCGESFEGVYCPACTKEIAIEWWEAKMDEDFSDGFALRSYATPCCGATCTMHELDYKSPQGIGRSFVQAMNPNIGKLDEKQISEFERILGCRLRIIYQHI